MASVVLSTGCEIELSGDVDHIFQALADEVFFPAVEEGMDGSELTKRMEDEIAHLVAQLHVKHLYQLACHLLHYYFKRKLTEAAEEAHKRAEAQKN